MAIPDIFKQSNILSLIFKIKWRSSEDSERKKNVFLKKIKTGYLYQDKKQYWENPNRTFANHFIASYLGTRINKHDFRDMKTELSSFARLTWLGDISKFMKLVNKILTINDRINYFQEKIIFDRILGEEFDTISLKTSNLYQNHELADNSVKEVNKALKLYAKISKKEMY